MAVKGARRNGVRGSRGKDQPDFLRRITDRLRRLLLPLFLSNSTLPPPNRIRFSVTFVGIQSFFGHGFFNAGVCDDTWFYDFIGNSMIRGLGNRRLCMSMVRGMGLHRIKNSEV